MATDLEESLNLSLVSNRTALLYFFKNFYFLEKDLTVYLISQRDSFEFQDANKNLDWHLLLKVSNLPFSSLHHLSWLDYYPVHDYFSKATGLRRRSCKWPWVCYLLWLCPDFLEPTPWAGETSVRLCMRFREYTVGLVLTLSPKLWVIQGPVTLLKGEGEKYISATYFWPSTDGYWKDKIPFINFLQWNSRAVKMVAAKCNLSCSSLNLVLSGQDLL